MSFIDEVLSVFGGESVSPAFRVMLLGDGAAYVEGIKSIKSYSQDKIEIFIGKGEITVKGEGLFIKKYCAGDLAVCGKIKSIEKN